MKASQDRWTHSISKIIIITRIECWKGKNKKYLNKENTSSSTIIWRLTRRWSTTRSQVWLHPWVAHCHRSHTMRNWAAMWPGRGACRYCSSSISRRWRCWICLTRISARNWCIALSTCLHGWIPSWHLPRRNLNWNSSSGSIVIPSVHWASLRILPHCRSSVKARSLCCNQTCIWDGVISTFITIGLPTKATDQTLQIDYKNKKRGSYPTRRGSSSVKKHAFQGPNLFLFFFFIKNRCTFFSISISFIFPFTIFLMTLNQKHIFLYLYIEISMTRVW